MYSCLVGVGAARWKRRRQEEGLKARRQAPFVAEAPALAPPSCLTRRLNSRGSATLLQTNVGLLQLREEAQRRSLSPLTELRPRAALHLLPGRPLPPPSAASVAKDDTLGLFTGGCEDLGVQHGAGIKPAPKDRRRCVFKRTTQIFED